MLGVQVSAATARRQTEQAGEAYEQVQTQQAHPKSAAPIQPRGKRVKQLAISTDGAYVPLRGGEWGEVKTLAIGQVQPNTRAGAADKEEARTTAQSYFSRLCDAPTFADLASVEIRRRGVERAKAVCTVQDGADWEQGFVDGHRHDAVRILDFAHAASAISDISEAVRATGGRLPATWLEGLLHRLKHQGPARVLKHLAWVVAHYPSPLAQEKLTYLQKRETQMQYPTYQAAGWPTGSGMVESANKVLVEARLKGAGMHWKREHVNPTLALRTAVCNDRWSEAWGQLTAHRLKQRRRLRTERHTRRRDQLVQSLKQLLVHFWILRSRLTRSSSAPLAPAKVSLDAKPRPRPAASHPWKSAWSSRRLQEMARAKK